jgi:predicted branched-subunit amino acid permease
VAAFITGAKAIVPRLLALITFGVTFGAIRNCLKSP